MQEVVETIESETIESETIESETIKSETIESEASFTCERKQASHMSRKVCLNKMSNHMFQQMSSSFDRK